MHVSGFRIIRSPDPGVQFCVLNIIARWGKSVKFRKTGIVLLSDTNVIFFRANARLLSKSLEATGWYTCVSDIHRPKGQHVQKASKGLEPPSKGHEESSADYNAGLPVVAFRLSDDFKKDYSHIKQESISTLLRAKQYIIPNYPLPPKCEKQEILRVVVRESMSLDLLDRLITDIIAITEQLMNADPMDLHAFQPGATSIEKQYQSRGVDHTKKDEAKRPMSKGVHRTVC